MAGVFRKDIWFSLLIPKIRPSPTSKKCFGVHILGPKPKRNDKKFSFGGHSLKIFLDPHPYTKIFRPHPLTLNIILV